MWLLFAIAYSLFLAIVNYIDEYLTAINPLRNATDPHLKAGGLLVISTTLSFVGALVVWFFIGDISLGQREIILSLCSAVTLVGLWGAYFYLLSSYPVYQVIPLFQLSSIWLLCIELGTGSTTTLMGLAGVVALIVGAYVLDSGTLKWQTPTRLLLLMIPATLSAAISMFFVRLASQEASGIVISFWQFVGIGCIGVVGFIMVKKYREGFLYRMRHGGRKFFGLSLINEASSQAGYFSSNMAIALAPLATYFSALGGLQSVFVLGLFLLFPQKKNTLNGLQIGAIFLIALGIFLLEGWKHI
jgi:hypothetical protein